MAPGRTIYWPIRPIATCSVWIALDDALTTLAEQDPRRSRTVELRVFGGLTIEETAEVLGVSAQSVMRDWKVAKAWLLRELGKTELPTSCPHGRPIALRYSWKDIERAFHRV